MRVTGSLIAVVVALALAAPAGAVMPTFSYVQTVGTAVHNQDQPDVAIDAAGNAVAVWAESDNLDSGVNSFVYTAYRPAGGVFGAARRISAAGVHALGPHVAMNAHGDAVAAWFIKRAGAGIVEAAVRPAGDGSAFGPAQTLTTTPPAAEFALPYVAIDPAGDAIVAWSVSSAGATGVGTAGMFASYRSAGAAFGPTETIAPGGFVEQLAMLPSGVAIVVLGGPTVATRTPGPTGTWGPLTAAVTPSSGGDVTLAMNAAGDLAIGYVLRTPGAGTESSQIGVVVRSAATGLFRPPALVSPAVVGGSGIGSVAEPTVALSDAGEAAVTWLDATGPLSPGPDPLNLARISSATAITGGSVSPPVPIRATFGRYGDLFTTATSSDGPGTFVVMGAHDRQLEFELRLGGGAPGPAQLVAIPPTGPDVPGGPGQLSLAENAAGNAVVVFALGDELVQAAYDTPPSPPAPKALPPATGVKGVDTATTLQVTVRTRFDVGSKVTAKGTIKIPHATIDLVPAQAVTAAGILKTLKLAIRPADRKALGHALGHGKVFAHVTLSATGRRGHKPLVTRRTIRLHA